MRLLTKRLVRRFTPLEAADRLKPEQIVVPCKFYLPGTAWAWYPFEFDGQDMFFGFVRGVENELGYFSLSSLLAVGSQAGSMVRRDRNFHEHTLKEVMDRHL